MNLTPVALEIAARRLAEAVNGGVWEVDYTEAQKALWRRRAEIAMEVNE